MMYVIMYVVVSWCCRAVVLWLLCHTLCADVRVRGTVLSVLTSYLDVQTTSLFHHTVSVSEQARDRPATAPPTVFPSCTARRSSFVVRRSSFVVVALLFVVDALVVVV